LRYKTGLASALDVEKARYGLESTRSNIPTLQSGLDAALNRLAILLGHWPGTLTDSLSAPAPVPSGSMKLSIGLPADLLRRRPDIREAERNLAAATARVGVAEADLYPKLTLSGSLGFESLPWTACSARPIWLPVWGPAS
jgi:outer membrane protein TolC